MIVNFRRTWIKSSNISFMGEDVEVVEEYKYFGVHLENRLDWRLNTGPDYKKGQSRPYVLRKLRYGGIC